MGGSLRRNSAWQLLQTFFGTGAELAILLTVAAVKGSAEFGSFAVALSAAKLVFLLFEARLHEFLTPKLARYLGRSRRGVWLWTRCSARLEFGLNSLALAACVLVAFALPGMGMQVETPLVLAAAAYTFGNTLLKFCGLAVLRSLGEVKQAAIFSIIGGCGKLAVVIVALGWRWSLPAMLCALALVAAATSAAQAAIAFRRLASRSRPWRKTSRSAFRAATWRKQRSLLLSNYATGLVEMMHRELDVQIAAWLAGPSEAGRYRLAKTLAMTMMEALNPVVLVLLPDLARRLAFDARADTRRFLRRITRLLGGIGAASAVLVSCASAVYLHWFAPQQAQAWLSAAILILVFTVLAPWMWCQAFLVAAGRPDAYLRGSAVGAALAIGLALALVARFGAVGSACAFAMGLVITTAFAAKSASQTLRENSGVRDAVDS